MPSEVMDQRGLSPSSFFYEEMRFPAERQVGFWKPESMPDQHGLGIPGISRTSGIKSVGSSPLEKLVPVGARSIECLELPQNYLLRDQKLKLSLEQPVVGAERTANLSLTSWGSMGQDAGTRSNFYVQPASYLMEGNRIDVNGAQYENSLFSSSLSEVFNRKLRLPSNDVMFGHSVDTIAPHYEEEPFESLEEIEAQTIGNLLPDDDDLLSGVIDEIEYIAQPNSGDEIEDFDLFSSGGGMELEGDDGSSGALRNSDSSGGISNGQQVGSNSSVAGEHPYGEHPSRTLFVRNINSNVEDSELKALFEQYGDIRTLYTACKHRGFVMISYYDIRAARNAMRALQNKPLRRRKLDIHFSIPKDNPSEKDINQGTLVVFNLDSSVSNDDLRQIFGVYGEIKEIRETPHKCHHRFIEFYDVRAAEAALRALNRSDIAGKRIKLEPSRPGGARRCLMQQLSPELEQEESIVCHQQGSPPTDSPSDCFGPVSHGAITSSCMENGAIQGPNSTIRPPMSPFIENAFLHGISSSVPNSMPSPVRVASVGNQSGLGEPSHSFGQMKFGFQGMPSFHPHSLPDYPDALASGMPYSSPGTIAANINPRPSEVIDNRHLHRVGSNGHSVELNEGVFGSSGNGSCPLHGHHYMWSNSNSYHPPPAPMMWPNSPSFVNGVHALPPAQLHGVARAPSHILNTVLPVPHHHHVGSAPAVNPSLWERRHNYAGESPDGSSFHPGSLGSMGFSGSSNLHPLELASHNVFHVGGNCIDPSISSNSVGMHSPQQRRHMFPSRNHMVPMPRSFDAPNERIRSRRSESGSNQMDNKKQYELDIDRIVRGEDNRTTLMIKNIPNKYTSKMLLAAIDEHHRGTYDFIYLPIDFKNKCNVGYAFINMIDSLHIVPFYQAFNGKKWEKFNSEKVASLAYARIQGKAALIAHFQNSSLMNEDKRCRPILFHSDGPNAGDQEPFPMGINIRSRPTKPRTSGIEENHEGSPSTSANGEESSHGTDSLSGSAKDSE
ncbi:protein MEI2-like 4 isoform X1 [Macadamia integrifolia]|uniref:protein MEI2-like 4 isoform X1 n=1 Tax=Macadamia integrifolia TaxID=60698 RepID=UPI001C4F3E69|nr:protein MEI2-like 4 isoform X1 [Macadamia integrifolia]XP_042498650.1 protein MEI2-like 4 isoform X1 [Macadamia integrifolia]XP_042498651.1 protein MEI2-like 4 isoform X1 [Macadamia integrifolia]XP_042498653.1 protein MEI2-like 4 isoform X1 [Macadamia integrifolia]XP_042498654.1 protein MEI2-like 4 isoform X1 [Macadamia integrifolia]